MKTKELQEIKNYILKNVDSSKMTKKAYKELIDKIAYTSDRLYYLLLDFKDDYIQDYTEYKISSLKRKILDLKKKNGTNYISKYNKREVTLTYNYDRDIENYETILNRKSLTNLEFMVEAEENFKEKFKKLISKLIDYDYPINYRTDILRISSETQYEFSFLISTGGSLEVIDARIIYACGSINAPHYRFITTLRNK